MNQYEWLAASQEKRQEAIDIEIDACNRKDTSFDLPPLDKSTLRLDRCAKAPKKWWQKLFV